MNYICGEKLSQRLHVRIEANVGRSVFKKESRDLYAFIEQRISRSWGKLLSKMLTPVQPTIEVNLEQIKRPFVHNSTPVVRLEKEDVIELCIQAVFSLFVAIFYKNADDPADGSKESQNKRDEREFFLTSLSSLLFWKKNKFLSDCVIRCRYLEKRFQLSMECLYV